MSGVKYVIVGNSTAAVGCVEGIRSADSSGEITVISSESYDTYSRPLISYLLEGRTDMERMRYRPADFYEKNRVTPLLGKTVAAVRGGRTVLEDGGEVPFDRLLLATGSRPFLPPFKGLETVPKRFSFYTLDDALALAGELTKSTRVLILGAGLIGLKCAEGIYGRAREVTVVDLADRIMPSILTPAAAKVARRPLDEHGVKLYLGNTVEEFSGNTARLRGGETLQFDVLVTAVGVRPDIRLAESAGAETNRGYIVNDRQETNVPGIYAAGDCAESYDITTGERKVIAILPNAYSEGYTAGVNMAGGDAHSRDLFPMNAIGFFGSHILSAGAYTGELHETARGGVYKALYTEDNLLKGFILIGDVARAGIYTSLIKQRVDLRDVDFAALLDHPQLMAFSRSDRRVILNKGIDEWKRARS